MGNHRIVKNIEGRKKWKLKNEVNVKYSAFVKDSKVYISPEQLANVVS